MQLHHALSNEVREFMLTHGAANSALLLDALYSLNYTTSRTFTVAEIVELTRVYDISERLIRSALQSPLFRRGLRLSGGRPSIVYTIPSPQQVLHWYMLYDARETSDTLPPAAFTSVHSYRKHMHAAMIARLTFINGGEFKLSRGVMARRLGVTADTIRNYERDLPVTVTPHITANLVNSLTQWQLPPVNTHDHSQYLRIERPDGKVRRYPLVRAIAIMAMKAGAKVYHMRQHTNYYEFTGDSSPYLGNLLRPTVTHPD